MKIKIYPILIGILLGNGCAHLPQPILPSHIRRIDIPMFENRTPRYGIEERLTDSVIRAFILDGRLLPAKKGDGQIRGKIISYSKEPLSYDEEGYVAEYRIWMRVSLLLYDLHLDKVLWEDEIEEGIRYIPETSSLVCDGIRPETEDEAMDRLIEEIASRIVSRTIDGW